jgi:hypothetical protein
MNPERFEKAKGLVVSIQDAETQLRKVASGFEVSLIRDLIDYEGREEPLSQEERERKELIAGFLAEEDTYKGRQTKPLGLMQPLPPQTAEEQNATATKQAMESAARAGDPEGSIDNVLMAYMTAHLLGINTQDLPAKLKFEVVDGYGPMMARQAKAALLEQIKQKALERAAYRFNNPWYKRLWNWVARKK